MAVDNTLQEFVFDTGEDDGGSAVRQVTEHEDGQTFVADTGSTYIQCAQDDCTASARPRTGRGRAPRYCEKHSKAANRNSKTSPSEGDPFAAPLTSAEKRLAKQLALPIRMLGMAIYRVNIVDGMIVGDHADEVANAWVMEGRVSKTVRDMSEAVAKFAGAGPLAMVAIEMSLEIASNHHIPIIGDIKAPPAETLVKAQVIMDRRAGKTRTASITAEMATPAAPSVLMSCENCGRKVLKQSGAKTQCMCGAYLDNE